MTPRFSSVVEEEGERATRLSLSLMELDGAGVQLELPWACTSEHFSRENTKKAPLGRCFFFVLGRGKAGP